jgi:hypothetical protein
LDYQQPPLSNKRVERPGKEASINNLVTFLPVAKVCTISYSTLVYCCHRLAL